MKALHNVCELGALAGPIAVAIGVFDGLHLGHRSVIGQAQEWAQAAKGSSVVITFNRHPNEIVAPGRVPLSIYPLKKKLELLEQIDVDATLLLDFDEPFSRKPARDFILDIVNAGRQLRHVFVGCDFVFGHKRSGTLESLELLGQELEFSATGAATGCPRWHSGQQHPHPNRHSCRGF